MAPVIKALKREGVASKKYSIITVRGLTWNVFKDAIKSLTVFFKTKVKRSKSAINH